MSMMPDAGGAGASDASRWTLVLEASTARGSVALFAGNSLRGRRDVAMGASREDALFPAVLALLDEAGLRASQLTGIVCGSGPGSFTSLRIAASIAKGLAQASGATLYAVPSLLSAAAATEHVGALVVHSDALRGERFVLRAERLSDGRVRANGDVQRVAADTVMGDHGAAARFVVPGGAGEWSDPVVVPDAARLMHVDGWERWGQVDLASWEPAYGRLAEAQVKWEADHARPLPSH